MRNKAGSPVMSAYSDRDPPSENSFSLPPISLKLSPSPESSTFSRGDAGSAHLSEIPSHYSSRASSFMFSRRSSRMSGSFASSPTKFPTIDRNKSSSISNLSSRIHFNRNSLMMTRDDICRSPSCPQLHWDDYEDLTSASEQGKDESHTNGSISMSAHPHTQSNYENDNDVKLPSIFTSNGTTKKAKRDRSLPRVDGGYKVSITDRNVGRSKHKRESLTLEIEGGDGITPRQDNKAKQTLSPPAVSGFLVPIVEADKSSSKHQNSGSKHKKRHKFGPSKQQMLADDSSVVTSSKNVNKSELHEEDEAVETGSNGSNCGKLHEIDEIARENKVEMETNLEENKTTQKKSQKGKKR